MNLCATQKGGRKLIPRPKDKEELFFTDGDRNMSYKEWEEQGRPICWYEMYNKNNIKVHEDRAYGRIKLITPEGESIARDMAAVGNIVVFSEYYAEKITPNIPYKKIG